MVALTSTDVTYVVQKEAIQPPALTRRKISIAFGDGALTYPAGGVPLDLGKLGARSEIESLLIEDAANGNGFLYKYDSANNKIRIYQGDNDNVADAPGIELGGAAAPAAAVLIVQVITD